MKLSGVGEAKWCHQMHTPHSPFVQKEAMKSLGKRSHHASTKTHVELELEFLTCSVLPCLLRNATAHDWDIELTETVAAPFQFVMHDQYIIQEVPFSAFSAAAPLH
eukprot:5494084-Amphidinium_carterae.1